MKLWGGRFQSEMNSEAFDFNSSIKVDQRLAHQDLLGSRAWAFALSNAGIISDDETDAINNGLTQIEHEINSSIFLYLDSDEDIHTAIERRLTELIGTAGEKLHTGRSRNDQVATDFRLWLLKSIPVVEKKILDFQRVLIDRAVQDFGIIMPGYTHFQPGQPVLLSHWWLSFFWPLQRDRQRLEGIFHHTSVLPLGAGAFAGSSFPIDRHYLANYLNFESISANSIDAVSDRDFAVEFLFCTSLAGIHISKLAEAVVIFTNPYLNYFDLSEEFSTGSSLMPQKKNPDIFELSRGKTGALIGLLTGLMVTLKGLPSSYDKDLQEDKFPVFQAFDTLISILSVLALAVSSLQVNKTKIMNSLTPDLMATDLADYLVEKGVPFRQAHNIVGNLILTAVRENTALDELPLSCFKEACDLFSDDVYTVFDPKMSVMKRDTFGGTSFNSVKAQIELAKKNCTGLLTVSS
jgi:argininosuccinate lyase